MPDAGHLLPLTVRGEQEPKTGSRSRPERPVQWWYEQIGSCRDQHNGRGAGTGVDSPAAALGHIQGILRIHAYFKYFFMFLC